MVILGRMFSWRDALVNVEPDNLHPLAPQGIPSPLALEITTSWQASNAQGPAETYPGDGRGKFDLA
jgi:hypothetical protein